MTAKQKKLRLELDDDARTVLAETLRSHLSDLSVEIANTDLMSFRDQLKSRKQILEEVLEALAPAEN